jgi:hypothetical protein
MDAVPHVEVVDAAAVDRDADDVTGDDRRRVRIDGDTWHPVRSYASRRSQTSLSVLPAGASILRSATLS